MQGGVGVVLAELKQQLHALKNIGEAGDKARVGMCVCVHILFKHASVEKDRGGWGRGYSYPAWQHKQKQKGHPIMLL